MRTRRKERSPRVHLSPPLAHAQEEEDLSHSSGEKMNIRPGSPLSQSEAHINTFSSSLPVNVRSSNSNAAADASMNMVSFSALSLAGTASPTCTEKERKRVFSVPVSSTAEREKEKEKVQRAPIPLDLSLHRVAMKKGVYDALAIYGTDKKERPFPATSNKNKVGNRNKKKNKESAKSGDESEFLEEEEEEEETDKDEDEEEEKKTTEKPEDDENENAEENLCVVCLTNEKEIVLFPCRHCALCVECAQMLSDNGKKCPMCRQPVSLLIHLH